MEMFDFELLKHGSQEHALTTIEVSFRKLVAKALIFSALILLIPFVLL